LRRCVRLTARIPEKRPGLLLLLLTKQATGGLCGLRRLRSEQRARAECILLLGLLLLTGLAKETSGTRCSGLLLSALPEESRRGSRWLRGALTEKTARGGSWLCGSLTEESARGSGRLLVLLAKESGSCPRAGTCLLPSTKQPSTGPRSGRSGLAGILGSK
jgi:hypothetical protein